MSRRIKCSHSSGVLWKTTCTAGALRWYKYDVLKHLVCGTLVQLRQITQVRTGSEIYVGCSNGELLRFALQADDPTKVGFPVVHLAEAPTHVIPARIL